MYHLPAMCSLCSARKIHSFFLVFGITLNAFLMTASCTKCGNGIQRPSFLCNSQKLCPPQDKFPLHIVTVLNSSDELNFLTTTSLHWPRRASKHWSNVRIYFLTAAEINPFLLSVLHRQSRLISSWHIQITPVQFWRRIWFEFLVLKLPPDLLDIDFLDQRQLYLFCILH